MSTEPDFSGTASSITLRSCVKSMVHVLLSAMGTLLCADVGVAMVGLGSDAAIESSDVVIMNDSLEKLPEAVKIARRTPGIARQNMILALLVKAAVLIFGAVGFAPMWLAVFSDV